MLQITIKRNDTVTNGPASFDTQELLDSWYATHVESFGEHEAIIEDISAELTQAAVNAEALAFLADTDWKVLKYRDQVDMGTTPDLSVEEFQFLLQQRQQAREAIL